MRRAGGTERSRGTSRRALLTAAAASAAGLAAVLATGVPDTQTPTTEVNGKARGNSAPGGGPAPWAPGVSGGPGAVFSPLFTSDGLITNEYAHSNPDADDARLSDDWDVTSGSLFAHWSCGWTGLPDGGPSGPGSTPRTGSSVFRLATHRRDFGDTAVRCWVFVRPPGSTLRTPARGWDGGHLWLRYRSPQELYALSFCRRDATVTLKRKYPPRGLPGEEGVYTTLATGEHALSYDRWHHVAATAGRCDEGHVRLTLNVDGRTVLAAEDTAPGRLAEPGGVGLRGDNSEMAFLGFTAGPGSGPSHCRAGEADA
ncbi:hypothetical protein ACGFYA_25115 [Streptomyces sp. NPDC048305]|uniref:hypothetical protein n=1 Tax=Streptomyces sp. NPDC048305 TaxID=3365532 RepID=UPI003712D5C5